MSQPQKQRNLFDDGVFKPMADIGQGKSMRLRLGLWQNNLQFSTKINDQYANLNLPLSEFGVFENWFKFDVDKTSRNKNLAATLRKGRDNQAYGMLALGVGEDGIWYIGCADPSGTRVKHRFVPSVKFSYTCDGAPVPDAEMSYRLVCSWFRNVRTVLSSSWAENYKTPEEMAYKPGGNGGQGGGGYNQNNGGGYNRPAPQPSLDFDHDIQF